MVGAIGAWAAESEVADLLRRGESEHPGVAIGSYPFFREGKVGANFVVRSVDPALLDAAHTVAALFADQGHAVEPLRISLASEAWLDAIAATWCSQLAAWVAAAEGDRICALRGSRREAPLVPAAGARGALRVLDALVRWYREPPADDEGLGAALDRARRIVRPGSRLIVLADPASLGGVPADRWAPLSQHHEVIVLLFTDPLELQPPAKLLPLASGTSRLELDLGSPTQRRQWMAAFSEPVRAAMAALPLRGVRVQAVSTDEPSDAWLPLLGRLRPLVA